jgi:putative transposase
MNTRQVTQEYRMNQWIGIVRECRESGQTVTAWCAEHDINRKKYYYWLKKIRAAACKTLPAINKDGSIIPLEIQETSISTPIETVHDTKETATADIVIRLGSAVLEIHNYASAILIENTMSENCFQYRHLIHTFLLIRINTYLMLIP